MARRLLPLAALAALLLAPAAASGAANQPTFRYPAPDTAAFVDAPADGSALNIDLTATNFCFFGCSPSEYDIELVTGGWNGGVGQAGRCALDGSDADIIHCNTTFPTSTTVAGSANGDRFEISQCILATYVPPLLMNGNAGDDVMTGNCGNDVISGGDGGDTISGNTFGNDQLFGDGGRDTITGSFAGDQIQGGEGRDSIVAQAGPDVVDGGPDGDRIEGNDGDDTVSGGTGSDYIIPGAQKDIVNGGDSNDTVSYEDRGTDAVTTIRLDAQPVSGIEGEGDTIATDVENVVGSAGADTITGSGAPNVIDSGVGNDVIDPAGGPDLVDAGDGEDTLLIRDGAQDTVECGTGNDTATADEFDTVTNCETVNKSRDLMSDVDNDGVPAPADCNDREPSVRPGLPDKPGDTIDQDCDGADEAFPRILSTVQSQFNAGKRTKVLALKVLDPPPGATVELRCSGKKCFKGKKTKKVPAKGTASLDVRSKVKSVKFRPKQVFELRIVASEQIGKVVQWTIKKNKLPTSKLRCLPPGTTKPKKC